MSLAEAVFALPDEKNVKRFGFGHAHTITYQTTSPLWYLVSTSFFCFLNLFEPFFNKYRI